MRSQLLFYPLTRKKIEAINSKIISLCLLIVISSLTMIQYINAMKETVIQQDIASQIMRFHVVANSDSIEDQALKLLIKDKLTSELEPILQNASNLNEARELINQNLSMLESLSNEMISEYGFTYSAKASIEKGYFPLKVYGDLSLPPGEYEAVRIELGNAIGQNWWCIMFPPLCFVDSTYSVVPDSSKEQLKEVLTKEEYDSIFAKKEVKVKIKFKLFSLFKSIE